MLVVSSSWVVAFARAAPWLKVCLGGLGLASYLPTYLPTYLLTYLPTYHYYYFY